MNITTQAQGTDFNELLQRARECSHYFARLLDAEPQQLTWLRDNYRMKCDAESIARWLAEYPTTDETQLACSLRSVRKQVMLLLILRDLGGLCDLSEVMRGMTALAELAVRHAQIFAMQSLVAQFGQPISSESGQAQELLVIGMGKLGGGELNVSSDIDLIFVYPEDGDTNGSRTLSNHEFFSRLGRKLIALINDLTADGFVFRVDMRLRPYGDSGPLVMSFAALEEYLVAQGREWERYAWIKARVISPLNCDRQCDLEKLIQPFVFRKYLDFGAFDSMRKLHEQIRAEVARKDRHHNIKLGRGGIREIEFIAQVFQLIRGGRDANLRIRPTREVLRQLQQQGELSAAVVDQLDNSYVFLRNLEHRLQYLNDQQTQELPQETATQEIIAKAIGCSDYPSLLAVLDPLRNFVSSQFEAVFGNKQEPQENGWWLESSSTDEITVHLTKLHYTDVAGLTEGLQQFRGGSRYRQLPDISRQRLDSLIPRFTSLCASTGNRDETLRRALGLLEAVARRAAYLAFLAEYPQALPGLVRMLSASVWASDFLTQHPILLDELLDTRELYIAPDWTELDVLLATQLDEQGGDTEREMDALRQFQQAQTFHLLAMDLSGVLPLEKLSDHLSDLADLILHHVLKLCWRDARKKHQEEASFAIIAYGKLGGRELGYASDLDLIFVYDDPHPDAGQNYSRLAQRINTLLSSYTSAGRLYEVDLRLRPNGESGLLVSSIEAFEDYQQNHAWVWEHQALTRARFSAGDTKTGEKFKQVRLNILRQVRDNALLKQEIRSMRQKIQDGHPNPSPLFDIKHDAGGMVDIEFMVQYLVLANAAQHVELTANRGNLALLEIASKFGLIETELSESVRHLYRELRRIQHQMRLNNQIPCRIEHDRLDTTPARTLWKMLLED